MKFLHLRAPSWERRGLPMATAQFTTAAAARRFGVGVKPGYRINPHFACKMNLRNTCATRHTHHASELLTKNKLMKSRFMGPEGSARLPAARIHACFHNTTSPHSVAAQRRRTASPHSADRRRTRPPSPPDSSSAASTNARNCATSWPTRTPSVRHGHEECWFTRETVQSRAKCPQCRCGSRRPHGRQNVNVLRAL